MWEKTAEVHFVGNKIVQFCMFLEIAIKKSGLDYPQM